MWRPFDCPSARWTRSGQRQLIGLQLRPTQKRAQCALWSVAQAVAGYLPSLSTMSLPRRVQVSRKHRALAGLIGAAVALILMLMLAGSARSHMVIMAGLAISTVSGAALATVLNFAPNPYAMQELVFWLLGSVSERGLEHLWLLLPALLIGSGLILSQRRLLSGLSLGDEVARSMGLNYRYGSIMLVLGASMLVGSSVAVAGSIGFVGLLVPHILRPLVKHRPDRLLIPAALAGAILVCAADMVVRLLPPGRELKLGVLTSLLGAPLFIWLVWKERKRWI